ncbi:hypothetical protein EVA_14717 [gut metagenome]|uniref:Uncharacterized protein n=1 Tax=gut metagenome TaxID=749906 RepID=J9G5V2_9ZZZZ
MHLVARVDALRRVTYLEIHPCPEPGDTLKQWQAILLSAAWVYGGLIHHIVARLQHRAHGACGAKERREVWLIMVVDWRGDSYYEEGGT